MIAKRYGASGSPWSTPVIIWNNSVSWKQHITNIQLYGELPPVSTKVQQRRMRLVWALCQTWGRSRKETCPMAANGWTRKPGKTKKYYVDKLLQDTGLGNIREMQTVMMDRGCWKGCVFNAGRLERRPRWGEVTTLALPSAAALSVTAGKSRRLITRPRQRTFNVATATTPGIIKMFKINNQFLLIIMVTAIQLMCSLRQTQRMCISNARINYYDVIY